MLCAACRSVFNWTTSSNDINERIHHADVDAVILAAQQECYICSLLVRTAEQDLGRDVSSSHERQGKTRPTVFGKSGDGSRRIAFSSSAWNMSVYLSVIPLRSGMVGRLESSSKEGNTISHGTWQTITAWISNCNSSHVECHECRHDWVPRRLLEIDSDRGTVRVTEPPNTSRVRYAALSHMWGGTSLITLIESSKVLLTTGVATYHLPRTFRDAVNATVRIGLKFLWIDSLCIMQDDEGDWQREAGLMHLVYGCAEITLAATRGSSSEDGLYPERNWKYPLSHAVQTHWDSEEIEDCLLIRNDFWEEEVDQAPLNQRAWVRQERLLSRRIIHFSRHQILWECRSYIACETYPHGPPMSMLDGFSYKASPKIWDGFLDSLPMDMQNAAVVWRDAVRNYAACGISRATDKLPALAGLARIIALATGDTYVAGMWKSRLFHELTWSRADDESSCMKSSEYVAPSWSWMCWSGQIKHQHMDNVLKSTFYSRIGAIDLHHVSDPFGKIDGGSLLLEAFGVPMRLDANRKVSLRVSDSDAFHEQRITSLMLDDKGLDSPKKAIYLPLFRENRGLLPRELRVLQGIIIERVLCEAPTEKYQRIGVMGVRFKELGEDLKRKIGEGEKHWQEFEII